MQEEDRKILEELNHQPYHFKNETFIRLADIGVFSSYADTVVGGKGSIILVGDMNSGKSAIGDLFVVDGWFSTHIQDSQTLYYHNKGLFAVRRKGDNRVHYDFDGLLKDPMDIYRTIAIFYMQKKLQGNKIEEANPLSILDMMFFSGPGREKTPELDGLVYPLLKDIPAFAVDRFESPMLKYQAIQDVVKDLIY